MHWWVSDWWAVSPMLLVSWVFWVIASITFHELAHGYVAMRLGDDTPYHSGHMTFNPLVHISQSALLMFALFGFTWGAMPVNPSRLRGRYGEALMAFAGPACNALQFVVLIILNLLWVTCARGHVEDHVLENTYIFLWTGSMINLMGFSFNLIPVPPLDGARILGDIFPRFNNLWHGQHGAIIGLAAFAALFFFGGAFVWGLAFVVNEIVLDLAFGVFGAQPPHTPF